MKTRAIKAAIRASRICVPALGDRIQSCRESLLLVEKALAGMAIDDDDAELFRAAEKLISRVTEELYWMRELPTGVLATPTPSLEHAEDIEAGAIIDLPFRWNDPEQAAAEIRGVKRKAC